MTFIDGLNKTAAVSFKSFRVIRRHLKESGKPIVDAVSKINTKKQYDRFMNGLRKRDPQQYRSLSTWLSRRRNSAWASVKRPPSRADKQGTFVGKALLFGVPAAAAGYGLYSVIKNRKKEPDVS